MTPRLGAKAVVGVRVFVRAKLQCFSGSLWRERSFRYSVVVGAEAPRRLYFVPRSVMPTWTGHMRKILQAQERQQGVSLNTQERYEVKVKLSVNTCPVDLLHIAVCHRCLVRCYVRTLTGLLGWLFWITRHHCCIIAILSSIGSMYELAPEAFHLNSNSR